MSLATMEADRLKDALDTLLSGKAAGRFAVIGIRNRSSSAEELRKMSTVTTYYDSGEIPRSSSVGGPYSHNATYKLDLLISAASPIDLSTLSDPDSSDADRAAALAAAVTATAHADELFDNLRAIVFGIIMDPENDQLGLDYNPARWITSIEKGKPVAQGALVQLGGTMTMTATVLEYPASEVGIEGTDIVSTTDLTSDPTGAALDSAKQGVEVEIT